LLRDVFGGVSVDMRGGATGLLIFIVCVPFFFAIAWLLLSLLFALISYPFEIGAIRRRRADRRRALLDGTLGAVGNNPTLGEHAGDIAQITSRQARLP